MTDTKVKDRMKILRQMDAYIISHDSDESIWLTWIALGIPDGADDDDYEMIAKDEESWVEICTLFGKLIKKMD